ncbi:hypothetical protein Ade02nite_90000 [Paractinoplanes deccanensis]|uniref:Uncharacterized protein n=1 Tax=Paractinoplanes deccanensis TaxID=113561 RepID=A0ABQ3YK22_9ACTN|nr:hypothetical protein Ade02nite_90000 [Actinoplanes deccanensis]
MGVGAVLEEGVGLAGPVGGDGWGVRAGVEQLLEEVAEDHGDVFDADVVVDLAGQAFVVVAGDQRRTVTGS